MKIELRVLRGSGVGKEVAVPTPKCLIGRGDECYLRPRSDAVSRRHCAILVNDGKVIVRDLNSKNGTFINGKPIEHERAVRPGDKLQIGPLAFQILIDYGLQGLKKPPVKSIKEAAERSIARADDTVTIDESDITDRQASSATRDATRRLWRSSDGGAEETLQQPVTRWCAPRQRGRFICLVITSQRAPQDAHQRVTGC